MNQSLDFNEVKKYNYEYVIRYLKTLSAEDCIELIKNINYRINLINQRLTVKDAKKRKKFVDNLDNYFISRGIYVNFFSNIRLIEELYSLVLHERNRIIGCLNSHDLFKYIIYVLNVELIRIKNHYDELLKGGGDEELKTIDMLNSVKTIFYNSDLDFDFHIEELCKVFILTLKMISFENNWKNSSGQIVIPIDAFISENLEYSEVKIIAANQLLRNSGLWDIVLEADYRFRFFYNELNLSGNVIQLNFQDDLADYALIANHRFQRILTQEVLRNIDYLNKLKENFEKDSNEYLEFRKIVEYENIKKMIYQLYFIDIDNYFQEYNGLNLKEMILSLMAFNYIADVYEFNLINFYEIEKNLVLFGLPKEKSNIIIDFFSLKMTDNDIYDNPIIKFSNDFYLIFPFSMISPNYIYIINSILSSYDLRIEEKGYLFESESFNFLHRISKKYGFNVDKIEFYADKTYQYDIILEWDDYIFLIECKNRSVPSTMPMSLKNFSEKSEEYIKQLNRLAYGLIEYKDHHKINIDNKKIIKVLLNSLPFALDYKVCDVYFIDFSSLAKFFTEKSLYMYETNHVTKVTRQHKIHENWKSDYPTVDDFLNYLASPFQLTHLKKFHYLKMENKIGKYLIKNNRTQLLF